MSNERFKLVTHIGIDTATLLLCDPANLDHVQEIKIKFF